MKTNLDIFLIYSLMDFMLILILIIPSNLYSFHPITLNLLLILYTILLSFKMNLILNNYWYSYILFLVMIGGLMILFMYFTSLLNNELFYFKINYNFNIIIKFILNSLLFSYFIMEYNYLIYFMNMNYFEMKKMNNLMLEMNLYKNLLMDYCMSMNLYMIMYLFLMMLSSVLICNKIMIPLRQMFLK